MRTAYNFLQIIKGGKMDVSALYEAIAKVLEQKHNAKIKIIVERMDEHEENN